MFFRRIVNKLLKISKMDSVLSENRPKKRSRSKMRIETENHSEEDRKSSPEDIPLEREDEKGDGWNIALLLFLYLLQGIPLGLSSAIPIILQNRKVSYAQQAEFSFVTWPFSMKLLWAPIVDSVYSAKFGRRKSWLIPVQYLIGIFILLISFNVEMWVGDEEGTIIPQIKLLTLMFFCCNFLAATQDIAVDGWALTMLHRKNLGHASTCNSVGQTAGFFLGYVLFIALDSAALCNMIFGTQRTTGLVSFSNFMFFWGCAYVISTTLVAIFKKDNSLKIVENEKDIDMNIRESYQLLWEIIKLKPVQQIAVILLTVKIGFAAIDVVAPLKLVENGVPKDKLALMAVPLIPLQIILPFLISKYMVGPRPMDCFLAVIPFRLLIGIFVALLVYFTPSFMTGKGELPLFYYGLLLLIYGIHQMAIYCMFVSAMAFYAKVSDPRSGGTYMTLLNTLTNLGGTWPSTVILSLVDILTWNRCSSSCKPDVTPCQPELTCYKLDGFFIEVFLCTVIGLIWLQWGKSRLRKIQSYSESQW